MRLTTAPLTLLCLAAGLCAANTAQAGTISYRNTVLGDSPLVYYEFDETSGTTAANSGSTGGGNTGTISGTVAINQSSFPQGGTSYDFGGGHVGAAAAPSSLTEWTLEAWINWDSAKTSQSNFFGNDQGGWNNDVLFGIGAETGGVGVPASNVGLIQQGAPGTTRDYVREPLTHSAWHHVVATGSTTNSELKLYVDGALKNTDSSLVNGVTLNGAGGIGTPFIAVGAARNVADAGYRPFDGLIDEFALYGTVLDATKVEAHYDAGGIVVPEPQTDVLLVDIDINGTTSGTVLNQSGTDTIVIDASNGGDKRMTVNGSHLTQAGGVTIAVPTALGIPSPRQVINVAGELTNPGTSGFPGTWFATNDISGGGSEANYDFAVAHFPFAGGWIAGTVDQDGNVLAGNTTDVTITKRSGGGVSSGNYSLDIAGVNPSTDGYLFTIGAQNENSGNYAPTRIQPDNSGWDITVSDQGGDAGDGTNGEDDDWSFVYIPKTASNLIAGRIDNDSTVLDSVGSFSVASRSTTGEYLLKISDGLSGFLGKDDGVLLLNVTKDVAPVFDGADDNFLLQQYSSADQGFVVSSHDLAAATDQTTEWSFAFMQFDSPPELSAVPPPSGSSTIVVMPDTQTLAMSHPEVFDQQTQWIKDHRGVEDHNIAYALQLGDITNNNTTAQWDNALGSMSTLDGFVPYAMAPGNHDYGPNGNAANRDSQFNDSGYFGPGSSYATQPSIGGFFEAGKTDNSWHTFNAGGRDWIVMSLEFGPRDAVVNWADGVMDAHPDHTGILITHAYTYSDDTRYDAGLRGGTQSWRPEAYGVAPDVNNGQELWDNLVARHNFALTLNGHVLHDGTGRSAAINPATNGVTHQILQNYQGGTATAGTLGNDNGFMRLFEIQPDGKTVHVRTYSPNRGQYLTDPANDFWIGLVDPDGIKASYAAAVQADAPIAQYRLETTAAADTVVNLGTAGAALDGTYSGSGPMASDYDGNDSTTIGPFADLDNWSVTAWVRPDSTADAQRVFSNDRGGWNDDVILGITPEGSSLGTSKRWTIIHQDDDNTVRTIAEDRQDVTANRWYHLAATADGDKLRLYVDGELIAITDRTGADLNFAGDAGAVIGNSFNGSRYFDGSIAELALFDKAVSLSDVTEHRMSAFRRVVAGNLINHSATDPNNNGATTVTAAQHAYPGIELPGGNEGDIRVAIAGQLSLNQREGVLLATVTQNIRDGKRGTVEVSRNAFNDGYMSLSTTQAGFTGSGGINEININTAVAWFPFAGGWKSAHVNGDGTLFAAGGVTAAEVTRTGAGRYTVALDGVDSLDDGMLFTVGGANEDNIVPTGVRSDGTWDVRVQDNAANFAATGEEDPFSFVYVPYDSPGLIGGRYDGLSDSHLNSVGDFTMTRLGTGQYQLTVDGETPETGMLLLTASYEVLSGSLLAPDDNFLTYEADGAGSFLINSFDMPGVSAQDTQFVWMFTGFSPDQRMAAVPEPSTFALAALGLLGLAVCARRRK